MKAKDTLLTQKQFEKAEKKENWKDDYNPILDAHAEISFKAGQEDKDNEWDEWRVKYIPGALFNAKLEGIKEYHKFMETPCPHFVADRAYFPSPCTDCYESKLKEWGIELEH